MFGPRALRIVSALVLALLAASQVVQAAGEFVIVAPPSVSPLVTRTVHLAAERCIPLYGGTLRTDLSAQVTIYIYPSRDAFVRGRQTLGGESLEQAQRTADYLGSAVGYAVLINQVMHDNARELTGTTCHEIVHVYQNELGTENARPAHEWMLEGYAYFMERVALEHLGFETLAAVRDRAVRALKGGRAIADLRLGAVGGMASALFQVAVTTGAGRIFPRLAEMTTQAQFDDTGEKFGPAFPHYLILMMDFLLSRSSHSAFVAYFKSFAPNVGSPEADENFRAAFGMTVREFQSRLDAHLAAMTR